MSDKHDRLLDKRPFFIILLITFFLILLFVFTYAAYQLGQQSSQTEVVGDSNDQSSIVSRISEISPFGKINSTPDPLEENHGYTRANPFSPETIIKKHQWTIELLEVERGESAWQTLHAAHPSNQLPPGGKEYVNIKLRIKNHNLTEERYISFGLTGDALTKYYWFENDLISPEPRLEHSVSIRTVEGWDSFVIEEDEDNLMLVFDIGEYDDPPTYLALTEGNTITFDQAMVNIARTELGLMQEQPVPFGQTATGEDWQIVVVDVVKGEDAWQRVLATNQFNDPPEAGMEYIMVKIHARYIGLDDEGDSIDYSSFSILTKSGNAFESATVVDPEPELDYNLYPGGEAEGWIVMTAPEKTKDLMLFFSPDSSAANDRYLSLGQGR